MRIGFDYHGVVDTYNIYIELIKHLYVNHSIFIITGSQKQYFLKECKNIWLKQQIKLGTIGFASIADYLVKKHPDKINLDDIKNPTVNDKKLWNSIKGILCKENNIDLIIDNEPNYIKPIREHSPSTIVLLHQDHKSNHLFEI